MSDVAEAAARAAEEVDLFDERAWEPPHREVVAAAGLASEVLVARRREEPRAA